MPFPAAVAASALNARAMPVVRLSASCRCARRIELAGQTRQVRRGTGVLRIAGRESTRDLAGALPKASPIDDEEAASDATAAAGCPGIFSVRDANCRLASSRGRCPAIDRQPGVLLVAADRGRGLLAHQAIGGTGRVAEGIQAILGLETGRWRADHPFCTSIAFRRFNHRTFRNAW